MKASIAPAPTDTHERIVKAAVTAVYDRYCSGSIAELESAVVALIGTPIPDEGEDDVVMDITRRDLRAGDHLVHSGLSEEQGRAAERLAVLTPSPQTNETGIELAARFVEKRLKDYVDEFGSTDPETGTVEFPGNGDEYVGELEEIVEGIRALGTNHGCKCDLHPEYVTPAGDA